VERIKKRRIKILYKMVMAERRLKKRVKRRLMERMQRRLKERLKAIPMKIRLLQIKEISNLDSHQSR
jgi:hypothetical protein